MEHNRHNVTEYDFLAKIKRSILLNNFDVDRVVEDARGIFGRDVEPEYVRGVIKRMQGRINRELLENISADLAQYVVRMHEAQLAQYYDMRDKFKDNQFAQVSVCCNMPIETHGKKHYCVKCDKETTPMTVTSKDHVEIRMKIEAVIDGKIRAIVDMILDLRDGRKDRGIDPVWLGLQQVNIYGNKQSGGKAPVKKIAAETMRTIQGMMPVEREKLIKKVESDILDYRLLELEKEGILDPLPVAEVKEKPKKQEPPKEGAQ